MQLKIDLVSNLLIAIKFCKKLIVSKDTSIFPGIPRRFPQFPGEIVAAALRAKNANAFFGLVGYTRYADSYNLRKSLFSRIAFVREGELPLP
ncbi:MAG: hypothetical protein KJ711_07635 [Candidatus Omnitrophica bacterium]|nr:hypothetical protein [Candidatus Omnitrophota bacterium]